MGISDEAARLREAVPEQFQAGSQIVALTGAFPSLLAQNPYASAIALEDTEEPQTDVERINKAATIEGNELNERRLAENAGITAGRIEVTGLGKQKLDQTRAQEKAKADADARMQTIMALQAQMDDLYNERDKGLADYLSPKELDEINRLPRDKQDQAIRDKMREKLENGEISQDKYDEWKAWYDNWSQREARLQNTIGRVQNAETKEQIERVVKDVGAVTGEKAAEKIGGTKGQVVEVVSEKLDDTGSAAQQNDSSGNFGLSNLNFDNVFGAPSGAMSTAHGLGETNPLRHNAPPVRPEFELASAQIASVEPEAKVELSTEQVLNNPFSTSKLG